MWYFLKVVECYVWDLPLPKWRLLSAIDGCALWDVVPTDVLCWSWIREMRAMSSDSTYIVSCVIISTDWRTAFIRSEEHPEMSSLRGFQLILTLRFVNNSDIETWKRIKRVGTVAPRGINTPDIKTLFSTESLVIQFALDSCLITSPPRWTWLLQWSSTSRRW